MSPLFFLSICVSPPPHPSSSVIWRLKEVQQLFSGPFVPAQGDVWHTADHVTTFISWMFFFFFLCGTKKGIFSHSAVWRWRVRGARWQLKFGLLSLQRWQTNKVQPAHSCRVLVEGSCGVVLAAVGEWIMCVKEGDWLLELFVSPRIGEVVPLGSGR